MLTTQSHSRSNHGAKLYPIILKVQAKDIVLLKFILESYEDLAVLRTLVKETGEIAILALEDTKEDTLALLKDLEKEMQIIYLQQGEVISDEYLLQDK